MDIWTRAVLFVPIWVGVGLATAWVMRRRGHDLAVWSVIGIAFGPLTVPLALLQLGRARLVRPRMITTGEAGSGTIDVLVGIDGSEEACLAARAVVERVGASLGRLTLAAVLDADASVGQLDPDIATLWGEDHRHEDACLANLRVATRQLGGPRPSVVVLGGEPAAALERYALLDDYDFLVVGARGRGASSRLLGSVSTRLAHGSTVPVIIGPRPTAAPVTPEAILN